MLLLSGVALSNLSLVISLIHQMDCGGISEAESNILISFLSGCDFNLCYSISDLKCNETGMNIFLPDLKLNYRTITLA